MPTQVYSSEMIENLATAFPRRNDNSFAWGNVISYYLGLPQLRGFWPMSTVNQLGNPYDLSGQVRTLTNNNTCTFGVYSLQSYTTVNGVNQFHSRADEAGLDITGNLTFGAWVRFTNAPAATECVMSKYTSAGNQKAYSLSRLAAGTIFALITTDGSTNVTSTTTGTLAANTWAFVAQRFVPKTSLSAMLNTEIATNIVGIPATIFNSNAGLNIGASDAGTANRMTGNIALAFLCAAACSDAQLKALYYLTRPLFYGS